MDQRDKNVLKIVGALAALGVLSYISPAALRPAPASASASEPEHDCSGTIKQAMERNPVLAEQREELCDKGGKAALTAMIKAREDERRKPAF